MHFLAPISSLAAGILFASSVQASYLSNELSFGQTERISPNGRAVPNWHLIGNPHPPEILSNKLVLTPPAPGNQRGAAWSENPLQHSYWTVDVDFRATGPERGSGNLNIWYVKNGQTEVATSSIYTVGKFDGLALVVDQYAGTAGFIRGFLNDGSTDYKNHHSVDSLAFGHCDYSYRNLGRPSRIAISQNSEGFKVTVDGNPCFSSSRIKLPLGNNLGITAATAENPDSFEVFKMVTTTESHTPDVAGDRPVTESHFNLDNYQMHPDQKSPNDPPPSGYNDPPDSPATAYTTSAEQFADLHNRLQSMMKHVNALNRDMVLHQGQYIEKQDEIISRLSTVELTILSLRVLEEKMDRMLSEIAEKVRETESALHSNIDNSVRELKQDVMSSKSDLHGHLAEVHSVLPGLGKFVLIVLMSQVVLIVAYILYKRRRGRHSKKYL